MKPTRIKNKPMNDKWVLIRKKTAGYALLNHEMKTIKVEDIDDGTGKLVKDLIDD